ncbi:hypothetical protein [Flavobacterium sp. U410]
MKYKFSIREVLELKVYTVDFENGYNVINNFTDANWTPQKVQKIIDGVENSRYQDSDNSFDWQNEDVFLRSNKYGVFFIDLMKQRAGQKSEKQDLDLEHDEFIEFLQEFKKFVEENS